MINHQPHLQLQVFLLNPAILCLRRHVVDVVATVQDLFPPLYHYLAMKKNYLILKKKGNTSRANDLNHILIVHLVFNNVQDRKHIWKIWQRHLKINVVGP